MLPVTKTVRQRNIYITWALLPPEEQYGD
jgi:hypothetical protein